MSVNSTVEKIIASGDTVFIAGQFSGFGYEANNLAFCSIMEAPFLRTRFRPLIIPSLPVFRMVREDGMLQETLVRSATAVEPNSSIFFPTVYQTLLYAAGGSL